MPHFLKTKLWRRGLVRRSGPVRVGGFTLIELLASMAILAVIVMMMGRIFSDAQKAARLGTREAEDAANARTVMDFIVRDISMAAHNGSNLMICGFYKIGAKDNPEPNKIIKDLTDGSDALLFVTLGNDDRSDERTAQEVLYYTELMKDEHDNPLPYRYRLMRTEISANPATNLWLNRNWYKDFMTDFSFTRPAVLVENVRCFGAHCKQSQTNSMATKGYFTHYDTWSSPHIYSDDGDATNVELRSVSAFADITLELLGEDDSKTAALLKNETNFVNRVAKKYERRVFLYNQEGMFR